jgi:MOSC domain-containing protein YiiM
MVRRRYNVNYVDESLLREAESIARNDGTLIKKFQDGEISIHDVVRLVSYAAHKVVARRIFDTLFYEPQLHSLVERLQSTTAFQENWGANEENLKVSVKTHG